MYDNQALYRNNGNFSQFMGVLNYSLAQEWCEGGGFLLAQEWDKGG